MFKEIKKETLDEREQRVLQFWRQEKIFEQSVKARENNPHFSFYDGPPFATGLPHYGHLLAGTIKDVVLRFKTMEGFYVPRRFGWDCHGLPIEYEVEKTKNLSGSSSIEKFGIAAFNEECRSIVLRYSAEWKLQVERMGRWVDFSATWHTMDPPFMESVWWVFKQLYDKGLVYQGYKVMPFSAKLGTPLSNFEAGENYKEVDDPSITVALPLLDEANTELLIWTTTPWTLISNLAVMAAPEILYAKIRDKHKDKQFILAKERIPSYYKNSEDYEIISLLTGKDLEGRKYAPLFPHFADRKQAGAFRVIMEPSVSTEDGTGLVHSAPAFGEVDFFACEREGIELVCPVDNNGQFTDEIPEFSGLFVKDADKSIIRKLKEQGSLFHQGTCRHRYPFCWRSDTPLIYKAVSTWFVAVEKIKDAMVANNATIHWVPEHLKFGRFGKWLEGARDWAISRNRYWGTPIPIWIAEDGERAVIGSIKELEAATGQQIEDIHRHYIDELTFKRDGKLFKRIPEVFDCWFESGSMPYAQVHYPFENRASFENSFPADFIAEGLDQTRGWFYTLTVLSTALFNKPAFKNVVVNGILLASDGAKMSKRLKNYPDPMEVVSKYGSDAVRLYMMMSGAVKAEDLRFQESGVELVLRQVLLPLWNAHSFFVTYAKLYNWKPSASYPAPQQAVDRWLLSRINKLIKDVKEGMDDYTLSRAVEPFVEMIDQLTNWYIRRSRRRFWADLDSQDRRDAFSTLYQAVLTLSKIAAPFVPFISEAMYQNLRTEEMPASVHLCDLPTYHPETRDEQLEQEMSAVQTTVSLGHSLRKSHQLKVRQPLPKAHIATTDSNIYRFLDQERHLITEELNVKELELTTDEQGFVNLRAKPNFKILGKKLGKLMKPAQEAIQALDQGQLETLLKGKQIHLRLEGEDVPFTSEDIEVERIVHEGMVAANQEQITIALDTNLNEALIAEGLARELVNKINTMRRNQGFDVADRISVTIETTENVKNAFLRHQEYVSEEVLALSFAFAPCSGEAWDLNGEPAKILITKREGQ